MVVSECRDEGNICRGEHVLRDGEVVNRCGDFILYALTISFGLVLDFHAVDHEDIGPYD